MANRLEAASDELEQLLLEARKEVELQARKVASIEKSLHDLDSRSKRRTELLGILTSILSDVKGKDLKLRAKMVVKAEKSLRNVKVQVESQTSKIERIDEMLCGAKIEFLSELQRAAEAQKILDSAKSEGENLAKHVATAEELIRSERSKVEKHAKDIESTKKLLVEVEDESKLQARDIAKAEKFFRDLKKKGKLQAKSLSSVFELFFSLTAEAKQTKKVEAAKRLLRELKVEVKFQDLTIVSADMLLRGSTAGIESHLLRTTAAISLLTEVYFYGVLTDPHAKRIEQLLRDLKDLCKLEAKNIAEAEKLVKALAN